MVYFEYANGTNEKFLFMMEVFAICLALLKNVELLEQSLCKEW